LRLGDFALGLQGKISSGNGVGLACAFLPPHHEASNANRRGEILAKFIDEIRKAQGDVILSSEFFCAMPVRLMAELVEALSSEGQVELVYLVRNQLNLLASTYMQRVKRHQLKTYPDAFFENWDGFKPSLMYYSFLEKTRNQCPNAKIIARPYDDSKAHSRGLIGLFLEMLGSDVPEDLVVPDTPINLSPSPMEIRLMLEVNNHNPRMQFSDMLVESSVRSGRARLHADHAILPPAFRAEVRDFFRSENEAFFRDFMDTDNQYDSMMADENYTDLREIEFSSEDVMNIVTGIMSDMDRRLALVEAKQAAAK
jgi:hypothetical protein